MSILADDGKVLCVIGPNGSGKTTLLKILDKLVRPDEGKILLNGVDITSLESTPKVVYRRKVGFVFQNPILYNSSVKENVTIGLRIRGIDGSVSTDRVTEVLRKVQLQDYAAKHAYTLSGGEAQRLCLARVLALRPEILLLDEPTAPINPVFPAP